MTTELKKITEEELSEVLRLHWLWLDSTGIGARADLSYTDMSGMNLSDQNLTDAILTNSDLRDASLRRANFTCANLTRANLAGANLSSAILAGTSLYGANLYYANLYNTILNRAELSGANIDSREIARRCICPVGSFIAFKKVRGSVVLKLEIPADAIRVGGLASRKCRANKVKVLEAIGSAKTTFKSRHNPNFTYTVGKCVEEPRFNPDPTEECAAGIHFFLTQIEAEEY